jgi:hypothetical protein
VDWNDLSQDKWWAVVVAVMHLRFSQNAGEFRHYLMISDSEERPLLCSVSCKLCNSRCWMGYYYTALPITVISCLTRILSCTCQTLGLFIFFFVEKGPAAEATDAPQP